MRKIEMTINFLNLDYVKEKIEKFNNKAKKLNKKQLELNYSNSYIEVTEEEEIKELIDITIIQHESLIISDYKLIAKIDHTYPVKNFVKPFETITAEQEQEWQIIDSKCEHCNSSRKRNCTFILQQIETLEYIQVGKSCLKDFLGHDIEKTLNYFNLLEELELDIIDFDRKAKKIIFLKILNVLGMVKKEIEKNGYKSSKAKYEQLVMTTTGDDVKEKVNDIYSNIDENTHFLPSVTEEQKQEFENIIDYISSYNAEEEREGLQEFYNNLKNILKYQYCKIKDIGIIATVFVVYDILKAKESKDQQKAKSEYVGEEGEKAEITVTLEAVFGYDTEFGYMHINLYKDEQGNIFKWSSKKTLDLKKEEYKTIKGTIKGHEEYNGQKQTILTRCKVKEK